MKIIISPAKSLDFESKVPTSLHTEPQFLEQSEKLNKKLKTLSRKKLSELMKISDDLAALNYDRNQTWETPFTQDNAKQAIYAFTGAVFQGIDVNSLAEEKLPVLQDNLRILSGLYGLLKPLDLIQPYRLEMGTRLKVGRAENLYKFWGDEIANALNEEINDDELFINLASSEYFKAVNKKVLKVPMITPVFKDFKNGEYKIVMTYAKKARGLMVRYIIENNVKTIEELKGFNVDKYRFSSELSSETELVFTR
ncbi:peroxide stress protein YaaA [Tenacibaculum aquimarinum]|uniref:peroxide stress protein YaaA n=1 Tax=Tenacibaculum aquimarinum TaxID=2910675 RepID=UPI001F0AD6D7|nr:peroxide stress protein YaaA [Tenacibaculum aquimarinum]MCH3884641.1 peroxide stress protein YaaA [Tenacibaculum aquimarinum]